MSLWMSCYYGYDKVLNPEQEYKRVIYVTDRTSVRAMLLYKINSHLLVLEFWSCAVI